MTVRELIADLKDYNDSADVLLECDGRREISDILGNKDKVLLVAAAKDE